MRWTAIFALFALAACSRVEPPRPGEQRSGLFLIRQNGRSGFVNNRGQVKIAPQFEQAAPFSDGLAVVSVGGRAGYIDTDGKFVINPQFDGGAPFSEGLAAVKVGEAWGFINKRGKLVIPAQYQWASANIPPQFSAGLAAVSRGPGTPVGFIDKDGRMALAPHYDYALPFSDGLALVRVGGRYGFINSNGK